MSDHVIHVTDDDFDSQVLQSDEPVLVDFWAAVVRSVQDDRADARRAGQHLRRPRQGREGRHRPEPRRAR